MDNLTRDKLDSIDYHTDIIDLHKEWLIDYYYNDINIVTLISKLSKHIEVDDLEHFGPNVGLELLNRSHSAVNAYRSQVREDNKITQAYQEYLGVKPYICTTIRYRHYIRVFDMVWNKEKKLIKKIRNKELSWKI